MQCATKQRVLRGGRLKSGAKQSTPIWVRPSRGNCFVARDDDDDADGFTARDYQTLVAHSWRIVLLQASVSAARRPPPVKEKSSYTPDQIVTLVDGTQAVIVDGIIYGSKTGGSCIKIYEPLDEPKVVNHVHVGAGLQ